MSLRISFQQSATAWLFAALSTVVFADERRAAAPDFEKADLSGIFFEDLSQAFRGERPRLGVIQQSSVPRTTSPTAIGTKAEQEPGSTNGWAAIISAASLEEEVKGTKLHFDSVITTPGAFNGGGYQQARQDLSVLAMLFAIINDYEDEIRWKSDAAVARDLIARTAFNCKAGSTQVYNEANMRKNDLQDLISGAGVPRRDAEPKNEWATIVDRSPLMEYAERLRDSLKINTNSPDAVKENTDQVRREAELLGVIGAVLGQEGMDDADDADYTALSTQMTNAASDVVAALQRGELDAIGAKVGAISKSCEACHEQYR